MHISTYVCLIVCIYSVQKAYNMYMCDKWETRRSELLILNQLTPKLTQKVGLNYY